MFIRIIHILTIMPTPRKMPKTNNNLSWPLLRLAFINTKPLLQKNRNKRQLMRLQIPSHVNVCIHVYKPLMNIAFITE